jgi:phage N-6-adenine-methyltransferase
MGLPESAFKKNDGYCTPAEVYAPLVACLGPIGLDPCASAHSSVPATRKVFLPEDGLAITWNDHGLVYVNPPFSKIRPWVEKASHDGDEVVLLLPARTGAVWFQDFVEPCDEILFWGGRVWFEGAPAQAPFHCVLAYWGTRVEEFQAAFYECGWFRSQYTFRGRYTGRWGK